MLNLILFIDWLIGAYIWIIIIQAVLSWLIAFNVINTNNRFVYSIGNALYQLTEPVVGRVRRFLPTPSGIDFSPMVVIIGLIFLQRVALPWVANSLVTGM
ncbi:MAG: YggT family protein [Alphaproteobacteria bacterium]|jgi:YggT family protein